MPANIFDRYHERASLVHKLDPRSKLLVVLIFILNTALLPDGSWSAFLLSWLLIIGASSAALVGILEITKKSVIALPFALAAITVLFNQPGNPVMTFEKIAPWTIIITDAGVVRFFSILLRSWLSVQSAILLVTTTRFPDLIHAMRHLHMPQIIVSIVSFMYRYMFVLVDETMRLLRARDSRSAKIPDKPGGGTLHFRARVAGNMAGQLFLRSYERSDRVYNAMVARGYRGELLTIHPHEMKRADWLLTSLAICLILLTQLTAYI